MQVFRSTILLYLCVNISVIWSRRINSVEYDDEWNDNIYERIEDEVEDITNEVSDIREKYREQYYGDKSDNQENNYLRNEQASKSSGLSVAGKKEIAQKDYLKKMSQVNTIEDFKRIFQIPESNSFKRSSIPTAGTEAPCQLRDELYHIPYTSPSYYMYPKCLPVKRCSGCNCFKLHNTCGATKTRAKQIIVYLLKKIDNSFHQHMTVDYVDDETCGCKCKRQPSECSANQTFNDQTCTCDCNVKHQVCDAKKEWSKLDCACICSNRTPNCPADHVWNKLTCTCDQVNRPFCPNAGLLISDTCHCK